MSAVTAEDGGRHSAAEGGEDLLMAMPLDQFMETAAVLGLKPSELMRSLIG
jgi:hypothetical protein